MGLLLQTVMAKLVFLVQLEKLQVDFLVSQILLGQLVCLAMLRQVAVCLETIALPLLSLLLKSPYLTRKNHFLGLLEIKKKKRPKHPTNKIMVKIMGVGIVRICKPKKTNHHLSPY